MPELPDIVVYIEALEPRVVGQTLQRIRLASPFLLRSIDPPIGEAEGREIVGLHRLGKRIVFELKKDFYLILHLMIAGRLHWKSTGIKIPKRFGLAAFDFLLGSLRLTEAGSKRHASLHLVRGKDGLREHNRGGIEILEADFARFRETLLRQNHTLKRALTDPRLFSGIGNADSDEILHCARLSPIKLTQQLREEEVIRLYHAAQKTLRAWIERLRHETGEGFPERVTALREGMAVHGRYRKPCPDCSSPVQRIVYAENETNYCAHCQTGGKLHADRALLRLLKQDWPRTLEELEETRRKGN